MKQVIFFIAIMVFTTSCNSLRFTTIDVRNPATVTLPPEVTNVLIVDNTPLNVPHEENSQDVNSLIIKRDSVRTIYLKSFNQFMNEEKYFDKVEIYPYRTNGNTEEKAIPLTEKKVQSICYENGADALISIDLCTISGMVDSEVTGYWGSFSVLGAKLGNLVRVYSKEGKLYHEPIIQLDSLYKEKSASWGRTKDIVPLLNELIVETTILGADGLTAVFIPSWQQQERWYYVSSSSPMKKAERLLKENKWEEASKIWNEQFEKEKNNKKKVRLASNIALAYEYIDNVENASSWIEKAYDLLLSSNDKSDLTLQITTYRDILAKRLKAMPILREQLGISTEKDKGKE